jgi:hypothetical protein
MAGIEKAKIEIGLDTSGFKKGFSELDKLLTKAQSDILKNAAKQSEEIEKEAQKQLKTIRKTENEKIAEIKMSLKEQIDDIKANENAKIDEIKRGSQEQAQIIRETPSIDKAAMQERIQAIRETENTRIEEIKNSSKEQVQAIRDAGNIEITAKKAGLKQQEDNVKTSMNSQLKTVQDMAGKQSKTLQDTYKGIGQGIKGFATGAIGEFAGMDKVLAAATGGPVAWGKLVVDIGKKAIAVLNDAAAVYREQEQAEVALQNAAKNNPYLNDRAVKQLVKFADEMQKITGMDDVQILQTETKLAGLGRNQEQIQNIIKTAADIAATGVMSYDEAVDELNNSLNGMVGTSGRLYSELKNLSKEALASGEAIEIIGKKVAGSAAEAMKTGAGSVKAYQNAVGELKKLSGKIGKE